MPQETPENLNPADWPLSRLTDMKPQEILDFTQRAIGQYRKAKDQEEMVELTLPASIVPKLEQVRAQLSKEFGREFSLTEALTHTVKNSSLAGPDKKPRKPR